jgi:hypothetical protein
MESRVRRSKHSTRARRVVPGDPALVRGLVQDRGVRARVARDVYGQIADLHGARVEARLAVRLERDPQVLQAEAVDVRPSTECDHDLVQLNGSPSGAYAHGVSSRDRLNRRAEVGGHLSA